MQWFEVDKLGLAKLLERKGKEFALYELIQNAWDEATTEVRVDLKREGGSYRLSVVDNNPNGFVTLSHAFTLFAESHKKGDATKRGRFNLGEKLVLALCSEATIRSTTGAVIFDRQGRRLDANLKTEQGSVFEGFLRMTSAEAEACATAVRRLITPADVATYFNGEKLPSREPLARLTGIELPTDLADDEGFLRRVNRKSTVEVFQPLEGEAPMLYEMGIPIVETGDRWHLNIGQKVPLTLDRENAPPAYLGRVRAVVADQMVANLSAEDANSPWVRDALQRYPELMQPATIQRLAELRFGALRVSYDPSDPEANARAVAAGYTVVHGSQLTGAEWSALRAAGAIKPAGQVTPSPKPFALDGKPLKTIPPEKWTPETKAFVEYAKRMAKHLMGVNLQVTMVAEVTWPFAGTYGSGHLHINLGRLGYDWLTGPIAQINDLLIHEFGHEYSHNHLSEDYYGALSMLGGKLSQLALEQPKLFSMKVAKAPPSPEAVKRTVERMAREVIAKTR